MFKLSPVKTFVRNMSTTYLPNQIIKNGLYPACKDCLYFKDGPTTTYSSSKCLKYGTKDIINGNINYEYAINIRDYHNNKCGTQGKDFLAKEVAEYGTYP